ncbi:MAG: hypothetical protein K2Q26_06440 [Bdellovibrionales bacterium]|nr:hypothetical protein [Bdellovibrionales bacterium]
MKHKISLLSLILGLSLTLSLASANWQVMVQQVTQLRGELETLQKETEALQKEKQVELEQWSQRRQEATQGLDREKMRSLQIHEKLKRLQAKVKHQGKVDPKSSQRVLGWIEATERSVQGTLPFQIERRTGELTKLKERVQKGYEPMEFIVADLWAFIESEMKLTQTNEYRILTLKLKNQDQKVEVARLGMQWMFAKTTQGEIFALKKKASGWEWAPIEETDQQSSVLLLVQDLRNKNDSGYYQLPRTGDAVGASL